MSERTPKNHKNSHNTPVVLCWHLKILKAIRGNGYRFVPKDGTFPIKNHHACCEKLRFVRSIYPNLPQMGQKIYHGMLMPLHDSMQNFHEFRTNFGFTRITKASTWTFAGEPWRRGVRNSSPFLAWDISINPWTHIWFATHFVAREHVHVVQI